MKTLNYVAPMSFALLLAAFNSGYECIGREDDWPVGPCRWAYVNGRRQFKGARTRALEERTV